MKRLYPILLLSSAAWILTPKISAQTEGAAFTLTGMGVATPFARDYQTIGINPANLDMDTPYNKTVTLGTFEGGVSFYSAALTKAEVRQNLSREKIKDFTQEQQRQYALEFANSPNALDLDITHLGLSIKTKKLGTFAFRSRDKMNIYYELGPQVSEILWLGYTASYFDSLIVNNNGIKDTIPNSPNIDQATFESIVSGYTPLDSALNITQLLQGTKLRFSWVREFNFAWGKKVWSNEDFQLLAGVGVKALLGQGLLAIDARDGKAEAFSSLSPLFNVDYSNINGQSPSQLPANSSPIKPVGFGIGIDLGATLVYKEHFVLSAAITDIGSMTWDGNVYKLKETKLTGFDNLGFESTDFYEQISTINGSDALINWQGAEKLTTKLPTTMRIGVGYQNFPMWKVGIDIVAPMNDDVASMERAVVAVGGEFCPIPAIHLQLGFVQGGNYDTKMPAGIYFTIGANGTYEFGVASRDIITFFTKNQPTVSAAFGFLRFRF